MMKKLAISLFLSVLMAGTVMGQNENIVSDWLYKIYKGDSLMSCYNSFEALNYYQQAFEEVDCAETRIKLANCYYQRIAYREVTELLKVMSEDSLTHEAFRQLVFSYQKLSEPSSMVYWADQLVIRYPMDAEMVAKLATGYGQLNQPQNGIECAMKYYEVDTTSIEVNRALANSYFLDFQFDKAAEMGERLLALGDSSFHTLYSVGLSYAQIDSLEQAYTSLLKAAKINDFRHEGCVCRLGSTCVKLKRYDEALEYLNIAKRLIYPDTTVMRSFTFSLGEANYMSGHPQEAIDAWKLHIDYKPNTLVTYYNIANAYAYLLEDREQAKEYYLRFIEKARAEEKPTPQLLELIERAENLSRELPEDEQPVSLPDENLLKEESAEEENEVVVP